MALGNQTDHLALLQFKQLISSDPNGILDSWNSSTHFCNWHGIICSPKHQRVTKLKLQGYKLHGSISPFVGNLSHMRFLNLGDNNFNGNIPQELGRLSRLRYLLLLNNSLSGEFPINLTKCSELKRMIGSLPPNMFHTLPNLQYFSIGGNNFSGHIPTSIANASTLTTLLDIDTNHFVGQVPNLGVIPSIIGNLSQLYALGLDGNMFEDVSENNLSGDIPGTIGECMSLEYLYMEGNSIRGTIPSSLTSLKGEVPTDGVFGNATQVAIIGNNKLCGGISQLHLPPCLSKGRKHAKHRKEI
ncbi:kinase-like protein [Trifolium pratense]|uniref:Kinase-like protein n=1 Tax=Trifolium pratense TaxID=57577 RepID=A0A2K3NJR8_TRIPR|nr:kinase-like protein [Trifolium pratense]